MKEDYLKAFCDGKHVFTLLVTEYKFDLPTGLTGGSSVLLLIRLVDVVKSRFLLYSAFLRVERLN